MHSLQACLFKYITVAAFGSYAQRGKDSTKGGGWGHVLKLIVMEITLLIMENHAKIMELCCGNPEFVISTSELKTMVVELRVTSHLVWWQFELPLVLGVSFQLI